MTDLQTMWSSLMTQLDAHRPRAQPGEGGTTTPAELATPVTLLSGFLGAGKSTLLARLLSSPPNGQRVRAVVNDIGSLPFDPTLMAGSAGGGAGKGGSGEFEIELTNGCGCCQRTAGLAATLDRVAAQRPDLIVLEASGVADPLALAQIIEASSALRLDRIVTVVAAAAVEAQLAQPRIGPSVERQLEAAHCVIVSHADQVPGPELDRLTALLAVVAPGRVVTTSTLAAPAAEMLTPQAARGARLEPPTNVPAAHELAMITTITVGQTRPLTRTELDQMLAGRPADILRAKGRLILDDGPVSIQLSASSSTITPCEPGPARLTIVALDSDAAQTFAPRTLGFEVVDAFGLG